MTIRNDTAVILLDLNVFLWSCVLSNTYDNSVCSGLIYYINKKQNIPHCRNNYKFKYQTHGKMKSETSSTQIYDNLLSWLEQELQ
jgi:hypothetical protein